MKKRLTERIGDGVRYDNGEYIVTCYPKNNNLTPVDELAVKLCDIEDKIENGTLTEMPCKVGDTVYRPIITSKGKPAIWEIIVTSISIDIDKNGVSPSSYVIGHLKRTRCGESADFHEFGETVFLTREEAEAVLAERKKSESDHDNGSD